MSPEARQWCVADHGPGRLDVLGTSEGRVALCRVWLAPREVFQGSTYPGHTKISTQKIRLRRVVKLLAFPKALVYIDEIDAAPVPFDTLSYLFRQSEKDATILAPCQNLLEP